jgi:hypothetical protein
MGGKSRNKLARLERKAGTRRPAKVVHVYCEGKLERDVLEAVRQERRIPTVEVHVVAVGADPSAIVREAKKARRLAGDETWVVFDRDDHVHFRAAITEALRDGFFVVTSVPCIELWAVLLYEDRRAWVARGDLQSDLKRLHVGYNHDGNPTLNFESVKHLLDTASQRAEALLDEAARDVERDTLDHFERNPTTRFHRLITRIQSMGAGDV